MGEQEIKKHRKRTKRLLNRIQNQMEFYFSDANLRHDNFLRKEIEQSSDGFVTLKILLTFNKLKEQCSDETMLAKAAENSELLQLNENREKVKRLLPIPGIQNTDDRTVYVEQLQAYHDHDFLKEVFSSCGTVEYISLPRYKHNNQIKGFAFIEFSKPSEAKKACKHLHAPTPSKTKTKSRNSVDKAPDNPEPQDDTLNSKRKRRRSVSFSESSDVESKKNHANLKRRRSASECSEESPIKIKKKRKGSDDRLSVTTLSEIKTKVSNDNDDPCPSLKDEAANKKRKQRDASDEETSEAKTSKKRKCKLLENEENNSVDECSEKENGTEKETKDADESSSEKKKKKKNRKHAKKSQEVKEIVVPPLYVITKAEWLSMRKQYKALQRTEIGILKRQMRVLKSEKVRRKELKERIEGSKQSKEVPKTDEKSLTPGTVVFLKTSSETLKREDIKAKLSQYAEIAYIDYIDGCPTGHVRMKSAEMLEKLFEIDKTLRKEWQFRVKRVKEEEEKEYLKKAEEDRRKKYQKNAEKKERRTLRGKEKVLRDADASST